MAKLQCSKVIGTSMLKKDHLINLNGTNLNGPWKTVHFDPKLQAAQDPLYAWSNLRSEYVAEASMQSAQNVFVGGGSYWYGPGWYWNPYWDMYGFIPGDGIWYSPFGWPFYSPWVVGFYGGYGYGFARLSPRLCRTQFRGSRRAWACER